MTVAVQTALLVLFAFAQAVLEAQVDVVAVHAHVPEVVMVRVHTFCDLKATSAAAATAPPPALYRVRAWMIEHEAETVAARHSASASA